MTTIDLAAIDAPCALWCTPPEEESDPDPAAAPAWCCPAADLATPLGMARALHMARVATNVLFRLSGMRFNGGCTAELPLCLRRHGSCWRLGWGLDWLSLPRPSGDGLTWLNGCGTSGCDCGQGRRIELPYSPVIEVVSVTAGEELLPADSYEVVGDSLYLCDSALTIPGCFDACAGSGLTVQWQWGAAPPAEAVTAACVLTCELLKACTGTACALPKRVQQVSRQGVNWTVIDPMEFLREGRTGLYEVDLFLSVYGTGVSSTVTFPESVEPINFGARARARW